MISQRSKWFLVGASLAPLGLGFALLADWLHQRALRAAFPGWRYINGPTPWYIKALVIVFYGGSTLAISSIMSILWDCRQRKRTDARPS
jgi:hypothetical protein